MNRALLHRGPDHQDHNTFKGLNSDFYLGSTRLSIINDDADSNQPFLSPDKRYGLIFNGEIYNYHELSSHTSVSQYNFKTTSDTEVLLAYLIAKGIEGISDLDGMFSFVFIDFKKEKIFAARDQSGVKPIYFQHSENTLIISSEIKGIRASKINQLDINLSQIEHYIKYRYSNSPSTFYKGVFELQAGQVLEVNHEEVVVQKYASQFEKVVGADLESILKRAILNQIPKNQPIGLLFSGGIDSSLILALLIDLEYTNVNCYTIGNSDLGTDDIMYATKITDHYNIPHEVIEVTPDDFASFDEYIQVLDQPIADGAGFLTWLLTKKASRKVKILVSGAGADELYGGYNRHRAYHKYLKHFQNNAIARSALKLYSTIFKNQKSRHYKIFADGISSNPYLTYNNFRSLRTKSLSNRGSSENQIHINDDLFLNALEIDRMDYLVNDVLKITDNMSMNNSVEVRVPYLSNEHISFSKKYSTKDLTGKTPKWMLTDLLHKFLPKELYNRPKQGFGMPFGKWIQQGKLKKVTAPLYNQTHFIFNHLNYDEVQSMLKLHMSQKDDFANEIWALCTLAHWLDKEAIS